MSWLIWKESAAQLMQIVLEGGSQGCVTTDAHKEQDKLDSGSIPD
jgi:hypothetical protein